MKSNYKIEQQIQRIRKQGRAQIIILVSSLILVFLWFTTFSWVFDHPSFGQEVFQEMAPGFSSSILVIISLYIAIVFTMFYIYILRRFTRFLSADEPHQ